MLATTGNALDALPVKRGQPGGVRLSRYIYYTRLYRRLQESLLIPNNLTNLASSFRRLVGT